MTYEESAALMVDIPFRNRVKVACLKYAEYINDQPSTAFDARNAFLRWAASCIQNPDQTAMQVQPPTVMDTAVQTAGAAISDAGLQTAVETTVKKMI